jgi:D-galactarolactone cycloisomerase
MKIERIETFQLKAALGEKCFWSSQCRFDTRKSLLVKIETRCGAVGWGEAGQYGPAEPVEATIHSALAPLLLGQEPRQPEVLWDRMYSSARDYGRSGTYIEAISGIDIALWDLFGRHVGVPLYQLFGGAFRQKILAYACGGYYRGEDPTLESNLPCLIEEASEFAAAGFSAVKMKIGLLEPHEDLERVTAVRKAIGGRALLVDSNHAYATHVAVRVARSLEKHDVFWFEEPVVPEAIEGYRRVRESTSIAIAGGECEHTRYGFAKWFSPAALDIAQPDVCCAGGFSEVRRIAAMASAHHIQCIPHVWGSAIALAAGIHLIANLPPSPATARPSKLINEPLLEWDSSPNPLRRIVVKNPPELVNGEVAIPDAPGLGVEPDVKAFKPFLVAHTITDVTGTTRRAQLGRDVQSRGGD